VCVCVCVGGGGAHNPPAGLERPSWRPPRWTPCSPSGSRGLHRFPSGDAGSEAKREGRREGGREGERERERERQEVVYLKLLVMLYMKCIEILMHLRFSGVLVGLDEDLADADVFAHGPKSRLHGLPGSQDGHACDLKGETTTTTTG